MLENYGQGYDQVYNNENEDSIQQHKHSRGQDLLAGGMALAGFKAFEDHQRKEGSLTKSP